MTEYSMWVVGQTIVLAVVIVGAALRSERRITKIETKLEHVDRICGQVPGISRAVARLEGRQDLPSSGPRSNH